MCDPAVIRTCSPEGIRPCKWTFGSTVFTTPDKRRFRKSPLHWPTGGNLAWTLWRHQMWLISTFLSLPCINIYMNYYFYFNFFFRKLMYGWKQISSKGDILKRRKTSHICLKGKSTQHLSHRVYQCVACMRSVFTCTGVIRMHGYSGWSQFDVDIYAGAFLNSH